MEEVKQLIEKLESECKYQQMAFLNAIEIRTHDYAKWMEKVKKSQIKITEIRTKLINKFNKQ